MTCNRTSFLRIDLQQVVHAQHIPRRAYFNRWIHAVLKQQGISRAELTVRVVGPRESARLNATYRRKSGPTNVLSFPFTAPHGLSRNLFDHLLGDIVLCAALVKREALAQHKEVKAHWAHLTVHGVLHLLGYDHLRAAEATRMEALEIQLLQQLGFTNPYED